MRKLGDRRELGVLLHKTGLDSAMQIILCPTCGERMQWAIHAEHVTAGCACGARVAAQHTYWWKQIPVLLRAQAIKSFGINGKWRIDPATALRHALRDQRKPDCIRAAIEGAA